MSFLEGAERVGPELYQKGNKHYAKFFLISDQVNLKKWAVTADSIPNRIRTFIGRPYVSEPNLEHFGADNMPLDQVLKQQEKFRAGTIVDVEYNPQTAQASAIVEVTDKQTWEDLQKGKAIYVSPAVAGAAMPVDGNNVFYDWFGLHLARVKSPAYGVFHATIKGTCSGSERECVQALIASASAFISSNDSFNLLGGHCSNNKMSAVPTQDKPEPTVSELVTKIASLEEKLTKVQTAYDGLKGQVANPSTQGKTETPDSIPDNEKQTRMGSASEKEYKDLVAKVASLEADKKASLVSQLASMKSEAGVYANEDEEEEEKKKMMASASITEIENSIAFFTPIHAKIMGMNEKLGLIPNTENRVIKVASASSKDDTRPKSLDDLRTLGIVN